MIAFGIVLLVIGGGLVGFGYYANNNIGYQLHSLFSYGRMNPGSIFIIIGAILLIIGFILLIAGIVGSSSNSNNKNNQYHNQQYRRYNQGGSGPMYPPQNGQGREYFQNHGFPHNNGLSDVSPNGGMRAAFCSKCGTRLGNNASFCAKCGAPVSGVQQQNIKYRIPPQGNGVAAQNRKTETAGETVILNGTGTDETTVLNEDITQVHSLPFLIRTKNAARILLDRPVFTIGKESNRVDYCVTDNSAVSRMHCSIVVKDGQYFIIDAGSTNHTYVNGNMIQSNVETPLKHGDKIKIANEDFEFNML